MALKLVVNNGLTYQQLLNRVQALEKAGDASIICDFEELSEDELRTQYAWVASLPISSFTNDLSRGCRVKIPDVADIDFDNIEYDVTYIR